MWQPKLDSSASGYSASGSYQLDASPQNSSTPGAYLRVFNELKAIQNDKMLNIKADAFADSIFKWNITFPAPNGKILNADLHFDSQFPSSPPRMFIKQTLFHPNISNRGEVSFQDFKRKWKPKMSIWPLILSAQVLLSEPNPNDPVNAHAANYLLHKPEEYHKIASRYFNELDSYEKDEEFVLENASEHLSKHASEVNLIEWYSTEQLSEHSPKLTTGTSNSDLMENQNDNMLNILVTPSDDNDTSTENSEEHSSEPLLEYLAKSDIGAARIFNDLMEIRNGNSLVIEADACDDSIFKWNIKFPVPNGRTVKAELHFDQQFPFTPPRMIIQQQLFHPNISDEGEVCFQIFEEKWSPTMSIGKLIVSVQAILSEPNPHHAVKNAYAANLLLTRPEDYNNIASQYYNELDFSDKGQKYSARTLEHSPKPVLWAGKRILHDLKEIQNDNVLDIEVNPSDDSIFKWDIKFPAPNGNAVNAELHFDPQHPFIPPKMIIKQRLFHPNISDNGEVCFQDFKEKWNPTISIWSIILSVQVLLSEPNPHDPANAYAANLLLTKPEEYHEIASGFFDALDFNLGTKSNYGAAIQNNERNSGAVGQHKDDYEDIAIQMSLLKSFGNNQ